MLFLVVAADIADLSVGFGVFHAAEDEFLDVLVGPAAGKSVLRPNH